MTNPIIYFVLGIKKLDNFGGMNRGRMYLNGAGGNTERAAD